MTSIMQHARLSLQHMSVFSTFRGYAKTQWREVQIRGTTPALAYKAREQRSRVWHTCGCGGAFSLTTSAKTDLTLQKMTDGTASYVGAARAAGDERQKRHYSQI